MTLDDFDTDDLLVMERKLHAWADHTGHVEALSDDAIHELAALILTEVKGVVAPRREQPPELQLEPDDDGVPF